MCVKSFFKLCNLFFIISLLDIRKLKAALATPLDFGDADNDGDNASEASAAKAPAKVTTC